MFNTEDTIVAISTAAGDAARAIVRLSGPAAVAMASRVFSCGEGVPPSCLAGVLPARGGDGELASSNSQANGAHNVGETPASRSTSRLDALPGFRRVDGIVSWDTISLPAVAYVFRGPRSFTRQDVVELHLPGSSVAAGGLQGALLSAGARLAEAGEFTARAFFSGRLDLSAAEAVADVIDAADDAQLRCATSSLGGRVARLCAEAAGEAAEALALVEASIDFAEEGIELASPASVAAGLEATARRVAELARTAADMPETFHVPRVVLCGYPNAGKSSLVNALAGCERAIVSPWAGTTRDVLSAEIVLAGVGCVTLQDAAGFAAAGDGVSQAADAAAEQAVRAADVVLLVTDVSRDAGVSPALQHALWQRVHHANPRARVLLVENKIDTVRLRDAGVPPARVEGVSPSCLAGILPARGDEDDLTFHSGQAHGTHNAGGTPARVEGVSPSCLAGILPARGDEDDLTFHSGQAHGTHNAGGTPASRGIAAPVVRTSAVTGEGLDELRRALASLLTTAAARSGQAIGLHARQRQSFLAAADGLVAAARLLTAHHALADAAELVAVDLRHALANLGQISGQAVTEDVLGRIFSRFCVGK